MRRDPGEVRTAVGRAHRVCFGEGNQTVVQVQPAPVGPRLDWQEAGATCGRTDGVAGPFRGADVEGVSRCGERRVVVSATYTGRVTVVSAVLQH